MDNTISQTQSPFATEPIGRLIAKFAIPSVIALLVNSLYNIVDQIFIGWGVGYLGNGATNVVFPITIIALALSMMIGNGGAAYLSLKLGEGEVPAAKRGVGNAVSLAVIVSIVLAAVFLLCIDPILTLFGATDILRPYALEYGYIIGIGPAVYDDLCLHQLHDSGGWQPQIRHVFHGDRSHSQCYSGSGADLYL